MSKTFQMLFAFWSIPAVVTLVNMRISRVTKKRWLNFISPALFSALAIFLFLRSFLSYTAREISLAARIENYFHNDVLMGFYLIDIPLILIPLITLLIGKIIKGIISIGKKRKEAELRRRFNMSAEDAESSRIIQNLKD